MLAENDPREERDTRWSSCLGMGVNIVGINTPHPYSIVGSIRQQKGGFLPKFQTDRHIAQSGKIEI